MAAKSGSTIEVINKIHSAKDIDRILVGLVDDIGAVLNAERVTIFVVDGANRDLVSRTKTKADDLKSEIRVPISSASIAGYCAFKRKVVNIKDAYDDEAVAAIDPELAFNKSWDQKTGFRTKQILAVPMIAKKHLLGVVQLLNSKSGTPFSLDDERDIVQFTDSLGIAIYNQKRTASAMRRKRLVSKFDYLIENGILSQKDLEKAIADARERKENVETVLIKELKVEKEDIGKSLSRFYKTPFEKYNPDMPIPGELLTGIKVSFMRNNAWVPLRMDDDKIILAIDQPNHLKRVDEAKTYLAHRFPGKKLEFHVALKEDIMNLIKIFTDQPQDMDSIDNILQKAEMEDDEEQEQDYGPTEDDSAIVRLVNRTILDCHAKGASDIHIEPGQGKKNTRIRVRIDGACTTYQTIPYNFSRAIISRIKIMSSLDIAERRKPQDGKIQ